MCKATHGCDALLGKVCLRHGTVWILLDILPDPVDLLVNLCPVMVAVLTCPGHLKLHTCRVPGANACNLTQSTVRFPRQARAPPSSDNTIVAVAPGGANDVTHFVLAEYICDLHLLLEKAHSKVDFLRGGASIDLDLFDICLLLTNLSFANLGVAERTDHLAVLPM